MTAYQKVEAIESSLRELFRDKDRLVGVDDWDTMIGILLLLGQLKDELQQNTSKTEEVNDNGR